MHNNRCNLLRIICEKKRLIFCGKIFFANLSQRTCEKIKYYVKTIFPRIILDLKKIFNSSHGIAKTNKPTSKIIRESQALYFKKKLKVSTLNIRDPHYKLNIGSKIRYIKKLGT